MANRVFVISDDASVRDSVAELVDSAGLQAEGFPSLQRFLDAVQPGRPGCLVLDAQVGDLSYPERRARFAAACARIPVLLITDRGDVPMAVRAMRLGAIDVLQKPLSDNNLLRKIKQTLVAEAATHR